MAEEPKHFFIVGMSRAGTTWVMNNFNTHPDIFAWGESLFWGRKHFDEDENGFLSENDLQQIQEWFLTGMPFEDGWRQDEYQNRTLLRDNFKTLINDFFEKELVRPISNKELFQSLSNYLAKIEGKKYSIEKTPHHLIYFNRILEAYPNAKFIVLIRKPYDFMLSYKHQGDRKEANVRKAFDDLYHPLGCSLVYKKYFELANRLKRELPDQFLVMNIEDVWKDPKHHFENMTDFLGIENAINPKGEKVNSSFIKGKEELNSADLFFMNLLCKRSLSENGFAEFRRARIDLTLLLSLFRTPLWAIKTIASKSRSINGSRLDYFLRWIRPN